MKIMRGLAAATAWLSLPAACAVEGFPAPRDRVRQGRRVGERHRPDPLHPGKAILLHCDGTSWTREAISAGGTGYAAIAAIPGTSDLWGVGSVGEETGSEQPFIVRRR
ncbi:hypothetical protein ACWEPL_52270 [Nonomuraea sp. NPDC004186]